MNERCAVSNGTEDNRTKMKNIALALCLTGLLAAGCAEKKPTLHIYNWSEYIDPDLVAEFEEQNGCRVVIDIYDSNESMWAKIQPGTHGYDLIFPSSYMVETMAQAGAIEKIDKAKVPNLVNIDASYKDFALDPDMIYGVPYMITYTGIAYRDDNDKVGDVKHSWSVFGERADLAGRMTILNDMRETLGAALRYKGYSINTTNRNELAEAADVVISWAKNIAKFENEQYKTGLASGEFLLVHGYSGDIGQLQLDDEGNLASDRNHVVFFLPEEGFSLSCDEMVVPVGAKNRDLAYKFINFVHDGSVAARNMEYTTYWCPNRAAVEFLSDDIKNNPTIFPDPEAVKNGEVIGNVGDALPLYTEMWDKIKASGK